MASRQSICGRSCSAIASSSRQRLRTFANSSVLASTSQHSLPQTPSRLARKQLEPLRLSTHFSPTQKASQSSSSSSGETANDDPLPSLQLLLRGGYIRSSSSGVFTLLPNALRIIRKITTIIDQELSAISATRLALPNLLPSKLWHQTGRYSVMGSELYKLRDRKDSEFVLGPTHEEEVTKLVAHEIDSDRQLPLRLYQVTTKFRDEPRPRMGLLRTKEFLMKDLYSFDKSASDAMATYDEVRRAYANIFDRIFGHSGRWKAAEADTGAIGGNKSHEYHVQDAAGEDTLISCTNCEYTANTEKAVSMPDPAHMPVTASDVRVLLYGCTDVKVQDQAMHAIVLPSARALNETKLDKLVAKLNSTSPSHPPPTMTQQQPHQPQHPQDKIELLYDSASPVSGPQTSWDWKDRPEGPLVRFTTLSVLSDFECASLDPAELNDALIDAVNTFASRRSAHSEPSQHLPLVDLFPTQFGHFATSPLGVAPPLTLVDVRTAQAHDTCPSCKAHNSLKETRAIEVGHTFYLGERYSRALQAGFLPSSEVTAETRGVERLANGRVPFQMGCYGIGVSRILGALAQKAAADFNRVFNRDVATLTEDAPATRSKGQGKGKTKKAAAGLLWPAQVAPFTAAIIVSDAKDPSKLTAAHAVWEHIIASARKNDCSVRAVLASVVAHNTPPHSHADVAAAAAVPSQTETHAPSAPDDEGWSTDQATEIVIDDRHSTLGSKLADSDLTGYAYRIIVGKHYSANALVEVQHCVRGAGAWQALLLPLEAFARHAVV
ncbi:hypothetical protein EX895_003667 [Sporisorium graminicola]|uniref:proline--tRNA ligase n=1 Tax=Sporisorium graminicola TaxID=280036 RepID=A0A4U7KRD2_9BASI|nr:hypothetical protein EX895_003667 [Sporisorium graminicola]TKY86990.1 hypothetical protein EX895_003667 [Sporisorium graminicola]